MRTVNPQLWSKKLGKETKLGEHAWESGRCGTLERRLRDSFRDAVIEFWRHSTMPGLRYVVDNDASKQSRWCYGLLMMCLLVWGVSIMVYISMNFQNRPPLKINLRSKEHDSAVDFPAIAICSNSIIRYKALNAYTNYLASKKNNNSTYSYTTIKKNLMKFGNLITLTWPEPDMEFMRFIFDNDPDFNVTHVMLKFSMNCTHMLRRCAWRGYAVECSRLFAERPTPFGFCCVFNSRYHPSDIHERPRQLHLLGQNYGLVVVVTENPSDAAVSRRPSDGFDVLMFDGAQYPLIESGLVRLLTVGWNESVYFPLQAHVQHPSRSLQTYSEQWRRCRLRRLDGPTRNEFSSNAWCLTECRRQIILALCNCLPFTLQLNDSYTTCTPEHLPCLTKHREKFLYYYPGTGTDPWLEKERQDSQDCQHCLPDCARHWHTTAAFPTKHYYPKKLLNNVFPPGVFFKNATILRFYYNSIHHVEFTVEINILWFELFAQISCLSRLLMGLSLLTASEFLFFTTIRWGHHFLRRSRNASNTNKRRR